MIRILTIFGTRPEAIKLAPVLRELEKHPPIRSRACVTAQHREMLDQVLDVFEIKPDWDLDVMRKDQTLFEITADVLSELESILADERPDVVLVQGDTTTAFVAALAAYYWKVPVGHVEAGLRTGDRYSPFPEEMNRCLADVLSAIHFAPTVRARENLLREGIPEEGIYVTGNTVIDALLYVIDRQSSPSEQARVQDLLKKNYGLDLDERRLLLVTGHRRESFGKDFQSICMGLRDIAKQYANSVQVVYPVHLNPNVRRPVRCILSGIPNVRLTDPMDYYTFCFLMSKAFLILTDSGGIQEEAPSLKTPVLVMRNETERPEAIEVGVARLVGTRTETIVQAAQDLLDDPTEYQEMVAAGNPFGDGHAAERIVAVLIKHLTGR